MLLPTCMRTLPRRIDPFPLPSPDFFAPCLTLEHMYDYYTSYICSSFVREEYSVDVMEKLRILTDAARYDVACTSSGSGRASKPGMVGNTISGGCCHSFAADGRCISLLKVLMTNKCAYDCAYCANRRSNDIERAEFTPRELADLTIGFYKRNYIEGLFVSSGVLRTPDYTMERLIEVLEVLRGEYRFNAYIHAKAIPGAAPQLVDRLGRLADRLSVNIELPSRESLTLLAPEKESQSIARPMALIRDGITEVHEQIALARRQGRRSTGTFAPAGQSTQMIIGATPESDLEVLQLSKALYRRFSLKRVFFSAYLPVNEGPILPVLSQPPLEREHRLYQADWLMRFYQFDADELLDTDHPFLDEQLDPKAAWALTHLDRFPVEVNTAPYEILLRVPGFGVRGSQAIVRARQNHVLRPENLKALRISLKKARFFVTCNGVYEPWGPWDSARGRAMAPACPASKSTALALFEDPVAIRAALLAGQPGHDRLGNRKHDPRQLSLFDEAGFTEQSPIPVRPVVEHRDSPRVADAWDVSSNVHPLAEIPKAFASRRLLSRESA